MDRSTRRRALDAAAKVAFSLSVFGCSATGLTIETSASEDPSTPDNGPDGAAPGAGGQGGTLPDPTTTLDATLSDGESGEANLVVDDVRELADQAVADVPVPLEASTPEVAAPLACNAPPAPESLDASIQDPATIPDAVATCCMDYAARRVPDGGYNFSEDDQKDPNLIACCAVVIGTQGTGLWGLPYGPPCCYVAPIFVSAPQFVACTPWGPPVPPAMPPELAGEMVVA
jgi:hypothetical protein